eukprot:scaffold190812_cov21-Tisochrysis_lutea.AAC.1
MPQSSHAWQREWAPPELEEARKKLEDRLLAAEEARAASLAQIAARAGEQVQHARVSGKKETRSIYVVTAVELRGCQPGAALPELESRCSNCTGDWGHRKRSTQVVLQRIQRASSLAQIAARAGEQVQHERMSCENGKGAQGCCV